jgi:hypothetical protein
MSKPNSENKKESWQTNESYDADQPVIALQQNNHHLSEEKNQELPARIQRRRSC